MGAIFIRALILYLIVLIAIRLMGKREIGQLQPFELVVTIMIADLASVPMQEVGIPLIHGIIPILALLVGQLIISYLNIKSETIRKIICGKPTILIKKGKIIESKLTKQRYAIEGLMEQLRVAGYANLDSVEYAVLETSGEISVIPKIENANVINKDLNIKPEYSGLPRALIIDGIYIEENAKDMGYDKEWVHKKLKENHLRLEETLIMIVNEQGKVYCQKKTG